MSDDGKINVSAESKGYSRERVAYDMMLLISGNESRLGDSRKSANARHYFLTLYSQCLDVVLGKDVPSSEDLKK